MPLLPRDLGVPQGLETERLRLRLLTSHDVVEDHDVVMSLDEHRLLGCVHAFPTDRSDYDAEVSVWVRPRSWPVAWTSCSGGRCAAG